MISLERLQEIEPRLQGKTNEELIKIRNLLYGLGQLSLEMYLKEKTGSKFPVRVGGLSNDDM
ncbi:MAG: hypothetical protein NT068_01395 [Candidatus Nomurabacteria bacterium]|nr:hypothetical protein [Candidatus Nomurabacteria bacterium]